MIVKCFYLDFLILYFFLDMFYFIILGTEKLNSSGVWYFVFGVWKEIPAVMSISQIAKH